MQKRFAYQNEDTLEAEAAAWVSWPKLELPACTKLENQPCWSV